MRLLVGLLTLLGIGSAFLPILTSPDRDNQQQYAQFLTDNQRFIQQLRHLDSLARTGASADSLQQVFRQSRRAYKRIEWLLEYAQPYLAGRLNGPPVTEVEPYEPGQVVVRPTGLQVIETYLFPTYDPAETDSLTHELTQLLTYASQVEQAIPATLLTDSFVLEAVRLELFRLTSLGITGYDTPEVHTALSEALTILQTLRDVLQPYVNRQPNTQENQLDRQWTAAIRQLEQATNPDVFDRVSFIRNQLYPLCRSVLRLRQSLNIPPENSGRFLAKDVATLSDSGAFRPDYLIHFRAYASSPQKVALGRVLFFDPVLSGDNTRSCASCHQPERAFTDGRTRSRTLGRSKERLRNAPTLLNSGLQNVQFFDSRVSFLEEQAHDVLGNVHEMSMVLDEAVRKLTMSSQYRKGFADAFPNGITPTNIRNALACYVRSLSSLSTRPDRYLRGEPTALTDDEKLGFNLFLGKGRCATCHFFPIYNGFVPPSYEKVESEIIGVPARLRTHNARIDTDPGRYRAFGKELHRNAFKIPTVRNVALTAPYMHNGVYKTLEQVVDFYNRGGGQGIGIQLDGQTLSPEPLNLSPTEQRALIAFMNALTDTTGLTHRPAQLPVFDGNNALNKRRLGGRY